MVKEEKLRSEIKDEYKWDLSKMFLSIKDCEKNFAVIEKLLEEVTSYKGKILESAKTFAKFYERYEKLARLLDKVFIYSEMIADSDSTNNDYQALKMKAEKLNELVRDKTSFIESEILEKDYEYVLQLIKENSKLEEYSFELEQLFRNKDHILSAKEEKIISKAYNAFGTGEDVFYNFDNTDINLGEVTDENGEKVILTHSNFMRLLMSKNKKVRKDAFVAMFSYYEKFKNTISSAYRGTIKENFFSSDVRRFKNPLEKSLFSDNIDQKVYDSLIETVHKNIPALNEYINLKKEILKLDEMHWYDLYLNVSTFKAKEVSLEDCKTIIFNALNILGKDYVSNLKDAFDKRWIDIYPNKGKKSGAYSWGCYDSYPYLMMNYDGTHESVSTIAHELGHSMHSYYSRKTQNYSNHSYPIFLAEIASTVNEVLLDEYMYRKAETKEEKIYYITTLLEKIRTTIYRQTMFAEFEKIVHEKYQNKEALTEEFFSSTYYELNKLYYGNSIIVDDLIRYEWERIPHFYSSFYVYKYATGLSCAISIAYNVLDGKKDALDNYIKFLSSGGSDYPLNILDSIGIDMRSGKPVDNALKVFKEKLEELKKLI